MAVDLKLKDVAEKIKILMEKVSGATIDIYSDVVPQRIKDNLSVTASVAADIKKRMDAEDVVVTFNKKLYSDDFDSMSAKIREALYISDHKDKISVVCKAYNMLKNDDETSRIEVKELAEKFICGEIKS